MTTGGAWRCTASAASWDCPSCSTSTSSNTDEPGLPGLERALGAHPKTVFIGHGPGWWASISGDVTADELGGYPKKPVAPGGAVDRLMEQYPNLYGDLSAGSAKRARDAKFGREFLIRRADRLLFGTDYLRRARKCRSSS